MFVIVVERFILKAVDEHGEHPGSTDGAVVIHGIHLKVANF